MLIAIAGPYSAPNAKMRQENLDVLNSYAIKVYQKGHIPIIGVNAALFIAEQFDEQERYQVIMDISMAIVEKCDAILMIGESKGANMEKAIFEKENKSIYYQIEDIPTAIQ